MIRTVIVDDNRNFVERAKGLLADDYFIEVVGEANNGKVAIQVTSELKPDLVLMDIRMPEMDGIQVTRRLKEDFPDLKIIMLTIFNFKEYQNASNEAGANGFIVKKRMYNDLIPTVYRLFDIENENAK